MRFLVISVLLSFTVLTTACGEETDSRGDGDGSGTLVFTINNPTSYPENATAGGTYTINLTIENASSAAAYTLYYLDGTTLPCAQAGGTVIDADVPASQTNVNWDLTGVANGTYCIYGEINSSGTTDTISANGTVRVQ